MLVLKKFILTTACLACLSTTPGFADWDDDVDDQPVKNYQEENWGVGTGALAGALVGGPPGFIIGAFAGKLMGTHAGMEKNLEEKDKYIQQLRVELKGRDKKIASLKKQYHTDNMMVASLGNASMNMPDNPELILQDGFVLTVNFKTDSDQIEDHLADQCRLLAKAVKQLPGSALNLTGYADIRGKEIYNLSLSARRIAAVKKLLVQEGIPAKNIVTSVKGEAGALQLGDDQDSYAFDRRVIITFSKKEGMS